MNLSLEVLGRNVPCSSGRLFFPPPRAEGNCRGGGCVCKWVLLVIHEVLPRDAFMVLPSVAAWHLPGGYHVVQLLGAPSSGFSVKDAPAVFLRSFLTSE